MVGISRREGEVRKAKNEDDQASGIDRMKEVNKMRSRLTILAMHGHRNARREKN